MQEGHKQTKPVSLLEAQPFYKISHSHCVILMYTLTHKYIKIQIWLFGLIAQYH